MRCGAYRRKPSMSEFWEIIKSSWFRMRMHRHTGKAGRIYFKPSGDAHGMQKRHSGAVRSAQQVRRPAMRV